MIILKYISHLHPAQGGGRKDHWCPYGYGSNLPKRSSLNQQPQIQLPVSKTSTGNLAHRTEHLHIEARQTHERQSRSSLRATCHDQYAWRKQEPWQPATATANL